MRFLIATAAVALAPSAASASSPPARTTQGEIVIQGRRSDQYRIPPELRRVEPLHSDRWREQVNRDLGCHAVGPRGCGPGLLRIISVSPDGNVAVGSTAPRE